MFSRDKGPLGLLAGNGDLPSLVAEAALAAGEKICVVGLKGHTDPAIEKYAAQVQYIELTFDEDSASRGAGLAGRVQVKSAEYVVFLELLGTLEKPRYVLRSEPPLNEDQIIPLLLYGRTPELLTDDEQRATASVANAQ